MKGLGAFWECILHHLLYLDAYVCLAGVCKFSEWIPNRHSRRCREALALQVMLTGSLRVCLKERLGQSLRHGLRQHLGKNILKQSHYASFII